MRPNDIKDRLSFANGIPAPDQWDEIQRREPQPPIEVGPSPTRRVAIAVLALMIAAIATGFTIRAFQHTSEPAHQSPPTPSPDQVGSPLALGWTRLSEPPVVRSATAEVWDGRELLVWGGTSKGSAAPSADGYALDPTTDTWRPLPPAPIARSGASAVWTGTEAIFWGGVDAQGGRVDGAAYDPATDSWKTIPAAPLAPRDGAAMVWTGQRVFVWGGGEASTANQGALYDPATDAWRKLSSTPFGLNLLSAVWTGNEVIVFGSYVGAGNHAASSHPVGLTYDPSLNTWGELPPAKGLSPQATSAGWLRGRLIAYDYILDASSFDPVTGRWSDLTPLPGSAQECYPDSTTVQREFVAWYCGRVLTFDGSGDWSEVRGGLTDATIQANAGTYQLWRFATLTSGADVVFFDAEGLTVKNGAPCYGCAGSPTSLWAYRP